MTAVLEVADIRIEEGRQAEFEQALKHGLENVIAKKAEGYISYRVQHSIETPERYLLMIEWVNLEAHTVVFRQSEIFAEWRAIVGPFFAVPPVVEHCELVLESGE